MAEISVPNPDDLHLDALRLRSPAQANRSVYTRARQVVGLPGAETWRGVMTVGPLNTEEQERPWRAFLFALSGPVNWFKALLPCQSHGGAMPTVGSAPGFGYSLPLAGLAVSSTILKAGQFMVVPLPSGRDRTVCLTSDLVSDASGNAVASFKPMLGATPVVGATVETKDPFVRMSLVEDEQGFGLQDGVSSTSFEIEEAF